MEYCMNTKTRNSLQAVLAALGDVAFNQVGIGTAGLYEACKDAIEALDEDNTITETK